MTGRSLEQWLRWQESLHPRSIDLGLDRVRAVADRLANPRPQGPVFTVAGTNGKGSTVGLLEQFLLAAGRNTGVYTSPHLLAYNERMRIRGQTVADGTLQRAFERVEAARGDTQLTFFEFGTLAAFEVFREHGCDAWVLEVGMGGRLDAVNVIDADYALITTISLDHQQYLGDTVEAIAAEKAGILRCARDGFYGDWPVPEAIRRTARERGAILRCLGEQFDFTPSRPWWEWRGERATLAGMAYPAGATVAQLRNISIALAAMEQFDASVIADSVGVNAAVAAAAQPGRFQRVQGDRQWVLDVAHNPQAVATLRAQLETLDPVADTTIVLGLLGDKSLEAFPEQLGQVARRWVVCTVEDARAQAAETIAARLRALGADDVTAIERVEGALAKARELTVPDGRIVVCGSFRIVGPALRWLGIY